MITQAMMDAIPDEWKTAIEGKRRRARVIDEQTRAAIDAMIIQYYPTNTQRQIANACGCSSGYIATRVLFLRDEGKISEHGRKTGKTRDDEHS